MDKKLKKKLDGECYFCGEKNYSILDCHRILPGKDGGQYNSINTITICANCHRKVHAEQIIVHGRYFCTNAKYVLHYTDENGEDQWK